MCASQRKRRVLLMIECGGLPVRTGVATSTIGLALGRGLKLTIVDVGMARAADSGGPVEGDETLPPRNLRLVATRANRRSVLADEEVTRGSVVERPGLLPSPRGMTRLTFGLCGARRPMRGGMALEAPHAGKPEFRILRMDRALVALRTGHGSVRAGQRHAGFRVSCKGEQRRPPTGNRMAPLTTVLVGRRGELAPMAVPVASAAGRRVGMVVGFRAHPGVTLHARHRCVTAEQRVAGRRMFLRGE